MKKKVWAWLESFLLLLIFSVGSTGCGTKENEKVKDLDFTVVSEELLPAKVTELIEERKEEAFEFTYTDHENLYLCVGYGKQKTGGYSIVIDDLYLTGENIYVDTTLIGPQAGERKSMSPSYPVLVIKTEYMEKPVVFH